MLFHVADSLSSCPCSRDGGHVRNLAFDGSLAQVTVIVDAVLAYRRVYDQVDLAVGDHIQDIRTAFVEFLYLLSLDSRFADQITGSSCSYDFESIFGEASGNLYDLCLVLAVYGDQYRTVKRQFGLGGFLCLIEGFSIGWRQAQDFSGGTHLRP